jgi:hypothetical protein
MTNKSSHGLVLVNAYSRSKSLRRCLNSIATANENYQYPLIVVLQEGFAEVESVVQEYSEHIYKTIRVSGENRTALENINFNRYLGYEIGFLKLKADWILAIEEDVEISGDAIQFCTEIVAKYQHTPFFKGINLGSREKYSEALSVTYSRQRYGLHGQASVLTKKTWDKFNHKIIQKKFSTHGLDSLIEFYLKKGFMVTPNNSRSLDTGWDGTHLPGNEDDPYFVEMAASFVGNLDTPSGSYVYKEMDHHWRSDIETYKLYKLPFFILITRWNLFKHTLKKRLTTK